MIELDLKVSGKINELNDDNSSWTEKFSLRYITCTILFDIDSVYQ